MKPDYNVKALLQIPEMWKQPKGSFVIFFQNFKKESSFISVTKQLVGTQCQKQSELLLHADQRWPTAYTSINLLEKKLRTGFIIYLGVRNWEGLKSGF